MKLISFSGASLRNDALGTLAAVALTLGAGVVAIGPHIIARGPTPADQQVELERRRQEASALDKQAESTRQRLAEFATRSASAVHLQPASKVNERLVEITKLAAAGSISIAQMTPGSPILPSAPPAPADKTAAPAATSLDAKAIVVPIKLAGSGSYPEVARFVHALREQFRDIAVTALHMNSVPGSYEPGKSSENVPGPFSIDLAWYAAPAGSADAGAKP